MTKRARAMLAQMDRTTRTWFFPILGREKGAFLARLIERERPKRAVEIGSLIGYSAILIAGHLPPGGRLLAIEASEYLARITEENVARAGLASRVRVLQGDALRVIPFLGHRFDLALIDANKEEYLEYLRALEPRLIKGAWVVADNTKIYRARLRDYLAHVRRGGRYESREHLFGGDAMEVSRFRG
jgi:predicted O-methyltransferase YrrM